MRSDKQVTLLLPQYHLWNPRYETEQRLESGKSSDKHNAHFRAYLPFTINATIYRSIGRVTRLHVSNTRWSSSALLIFEREIFRRIYGPKYEDGEWKSRANRELEEVSKGENIVKWIKGQRISWLGHLGRMEEDRMPKQIFTQELEATRQRGRPRKGWGEEVERDLQVLGVRRWRELVTDREKWRGIVRQAKAHSGL